MIDSQPIDSQPPTYDGPALSAQLDEALETLRAIRHGEVDALVVHDEQPGAQVFTLSSADRPYRMFVETMRDGAATVSAQGVVLYANEQLAKLLNVAVTSIVGGPLGAFVPAEHADALLDQRHPQGSSSEVEVEISLGGEPVWTRVGATTLDVDGERMSCLTFADLSAARRHDAELAHAHDQALEALRVRSLFVANMSHEIRTPLNGVLGMAQLMLATELSDEQREYADGVRASATALMSVVDQILDFSKLDNGHLQLEYAEFEPLTVLEEACSVVSSAAAAKGVELLSSVEGDVPAQVMGDPTRLRQVLTNLMTNAVKFTEVGHVATAMSARLEGGGWRLRFSVRDTGIGVSAQAKKHIFEAFSQADDSTTRQFGGTGLGLSICKQLVAMMGGEIGVDSAEGEGSCFWFTLLVGSVPGAKLLGAPQAPLTGRVLVVDDNALSRQLLQQQLSRWGLSCTAADSGAAALDLFWQASVDSTFDVAVVDCDMPQMTGIELVSVLRALPERVGSAKLPVVMMMTSQRDREVARSAGVQWFVSKPLRQERLYETVATALGPARLARPAGSPPVPEPNPVTDAVPRAAAPAGPSRRVLLVEDNHINQLVGARMLEKRGLDVDVAANGEVAVEMHSREPYCAIFMDCHMPVLDGYQAAAEIRRRERGEEHVPIVAMTANIVKGDREKCLAAGMDSYLSKPFTTEALDAALEFALGAAGSTAATALLDPEALEDLCLGDDEIRQDLVTMFVDQSQLSLAEITAALDAEDPKALVARAHNLKGSSASLGAMRMAELSDRLCVAGRAGVLEGTRELLAELRRTANLTWDAMADRPRALRASA